MNPSFLCGLTRGRQARSRECLACRPRVKRRDLRDTTLATLISGRRFPGRLFRWMVAQSQQILPEGCHRITYEDNETVQLSDGVSWPVQPVILRPRFRLF